jgi:hypothetical protein
MAHPILAPQPLASFPIASPSPTSSLLSMDSPARMQSGYGPPSPSPPPALVSQDSVGGFAFGAPGSAAFSAVRPTQQPSPQQQHSLARAAFANVVVAQHSGSGDGTAHDVRAHDPRLVRAALDPSNTFVGAAQLGISGENSAYDASFRNFCADESRTDQFSVGREQDRLSSVHNSDGPSAGLSSF